MPKIRGVKPDFWTDDAIVELSAHARLLYIGMWNYACDNGHLEDRPRQIKMRVLPADDVSVVELLDELTAGGRIHREDGWLTVPNLAIHNRIDKRYFTTCNKPGCTKPAEVEASNSRPEPRSPKGRTTGTRSAHAGDSVGPRVDGEGEGDGGGDGETAAAAAETRSGSSRSDDLPGDLAVLRTRMAHYSALAALRWDTLTAEQTRTISDLIARHGDQALVDCALRTCRAQPPTFVAAFIGTWKALGAPKVVGPPEPRCTICDRRESACKAANDNAHESVRHEFQESA